MLEFPLVVILYKTGNQPLFSTVRLHHGKISSGLPGNYSHQHGEYFPLLVFYKIKKSGVGFPGGKIGGNFLADAAVVEENCPGARTRQEAPGR